MPKEEFHNSPPKKSADQEHEEYAQAVIRSIADRSRQPVSPGRVKALIADTKKLIDKLAAKEAEYRTARKTQEKRLDKLEIHLKEMEGGSDEG